MANPNISVDVSGNTAKLQQQINQVARRPVVVDVRAGGAGAAQPLGKLSGQIGEIDKSLAAANARVIAFGAAAGTIFALQNAVTSLFKTFVDTEKKLQDINVLLNLTDKNLASFGNSLFDIAGNTAQSFDVVAEAATELSRQGLGVEETLKRTEAALILTRLSGLDAAASVSALTAAINSFQNSALEATEIVNKLANVDAAFAVSSADLANALSRVGSSADDAGVSFDELIALVTTAQQITARGGSVIGNSLKTIFTRLGRGRVQEVLGSLGISATDEQGQVKNQVQLLKELASVYDTLSATQKNYVAEQVGGVFQINILKAALGDLGKEYSIYDRALQTSLSTTDQAIQRNNELNQTLSALGTKTLANVQKAAVSVGEGLFGDAARNVLNITNFLAEGVTNADAQSIGGQIGKGVIDGLSAFIAGPGLALATGVIVKLLADFAKYGAEAFRSILGTNTAAKEQAVVQQNIAKFLQNNSGFYNSILKGQISVSSAAKEYLAVIQSQTAALQKQNAVAASISKNLAGSVGIATFGGKQFIATKGKGKTAAGGYFPEAVEQANINARIGGANPATDKPVRIPNFALGGGKRGTVTAHTGEWAVPNFAGGDGTAIFNRDMKKKYGLPKGARKISSSGFIPNFAGQYSYALSTFAGKGVKNPRAEKQFNKYFQKGSFQNIEPDDRINTVGFKIVRLKLPPDLQALYDTQPGSPAFTSQFEKYAIQKLGFAPSDSSASGFKLYGGPSAAVDGYKIANGVAKFLEVKGGGFETLAVANKFGRVLPENLSRLPQTELKKLFKEGVRERKDIVQLDNTLAVPDIRGARRGNFNRPFRVADIEASRMRGMSRASGFIPNFAKTTKEVDNVINLGDLASNPSYRSKLVSAIIPQPTQNVVKIPAQAVYGDKTYKTTGVPVSGPNPNVVKNLSGQSVPNLHKALGKEIVNQANLFGKSLGATSFISSVSELPNLGGVNSAAGVAFERGVQNAIGGSVSSSKIARIDFNKVNPKLKKIFNNAPGVYEAKSRPSPNLINDVFRKFLSRLKPGGAKLTQSAGIAARSARVRELTAQGLSKTERNKILKQEGLAAGGFIPNFVNVGAIQNLLKSGSGATEGERQAAKAALIRIQSSALRKLGSTDKLIKFKELLYGRKSNAGFNLDAIKIKDLNYKPLIAGAQELGLTKKDLELLATNPLAVSQLRTFDPKISGRSKLFAGGFVPNFANASTNKGIPVSQIRAHFDKSGNPIAVTNTRDEPNGLKDAIKREKRGIGMPGPIGASGFIPNFAVEEAAEETEGALSKLAKGFSSVALEIALFASIAAAQRKDTGKLKDTYKERAQIERKAIAQEKANLKRMSTMGPGPLQRGSAQYNAAMSGIEQRAQAQRAARRSSTGPLQRGLSSVRGFTPGIGTAFVAPIIAETIANQIPQQSRGGRAGAAAVSGLGTAASFAGIGGLVGGPKGAIIGGVIGSFVALKQTIDQLNTSLPEFQAATEKSRENLARVSENTQNLLSSYEQYTTLLESGTANQEDIDKAQKNFTEFLNKFDPKDAERIIKALERSGKEGLRTEVGRVGEEAANDTAAKQIAEKFQGAFEKLDFNPQSTRAVSTFGGEGLPMDLFGIDKKPNIISKDAAKIFQEAIVEGAKLSKEPISDRLSRLGGIANIEQNIEAFIKDFLAPITDEEKINQILKSDNSKQAFIKILKGAVEGLQSGAEQGEKAAKALGVSAGKNVISTFAKEVISGLAGQIDSILSYKPKTSQLGQLQDQFFAGDISRDEFIAKRSLERIAVARQLGATPEEIATKFATDLQNVTNQIGNNLAQQAFDLGLGSEFQTKARNLAAPVSAEVSGVNKVDLAKITEIFKNKFDQFTGLSIPSKNEILKSDLNKMIDSGALSKEDATRVYYNVMDKLSISLETSSQAALSNFELVNSASQTVLSNFEQASSIAADIANIFSNISIPENVPQGNQPEVMPTAPTTVNPENSVPLSFNISAPSISITAGSNEQILSQLDTKLNDAKQRILDDVKFQIQQIKDRNGLRP